MYSLFDFQDKLKLYWGETKPIYVHGCRQKIIKNVLCHQYNAISEDCQNVSGYVLKKCFHYPVKGAYISFENDRTFEFCITDKKGHFHFKSPFLNTICKVQIYKKGKRLFSRDKVVIDERYINFCV